MFGAVKDKVKVDENEPILIVDDQYLRNFSELYKNITKDETDLQ